MAITLAVIGSILGSLLILWVYMACENAPKTRDNRRAMGKE